MRIVSHSNYLNGFILKILFTSLIFFIEIIPLHKQTHNAHTHTQSMYIRERERVLEQRQT